MNDMYHAQILIEEAFKAHDVKFMSEDKGCIVAGFTVDNGPNARVRFINRDDDNDVAIRLYRLVNVKPEKRLQVIDAINEINCKFRYVKFCLDKDGDVNVEYDIPVNADDDCVGEMCFEVFVRFMKIVDEAFPMLMEPIFTSPRIDL